MVIVQTSLPLMVLSVYPPLFPERTLQGWPVPGQCTEGFWVLHTGRPCKKPRMRRRALEERGNLPRRPGGRGKTNKSVEEDGVELSAHNSYTQFSSAAASPLWKQWESTTYGEVKGISKDLSNVNLIYISLRVSIKGQVMYFLLNALLLSNILLYY